MTDENEQRLRKLAERRADAKLGFRTHLMAYVVVNGALAALNLLTSPSYLWFIWPMLGWGIGLAAHGLSVYAHAGDQRERMVEKELERLRRGPGGGK